VFNYFDSYIIEPASLDAILHHSTFNDDPRSYYGYILKPLTQEEKETLLPVFEAWERALDNWEIEGL
jgi:hypothetical protein